MPLDRSPIATPETSASISSDEFQQHVINNLKSLRHIGSELHQQGQPNEIHSNEFRLLKLPNFWHKQPKLCTVVRHHDEQSLLVIPEIIKNLPEKDKYLHIKNILINRFMDSEEKSSTISRNRIK
ncbi:hypothetical protein ACFW04_014684 [Cataglyphis niger]